MWARLAVVAAVVCLGGCNIHGVLVNKIACREGPAHFNASAGTITSPLSPRGFPVLVSCTWVLHNPANKPIIFSFSTFDLDQDEQCEEKAKSQDCCLHQWLVVKTEEHSPPPNNRRSRESMEDALKKIVQSHKLELGGLGRSHGGVRQHSAKPRGGGRNNTGYARKVGASTDFSSGHMCGSAKPRPIITNAPKVVIKFYSDTKVRRDHQGFMLQFQMSGNTTACGAEEFTCEDSRLCIPKSWKCNGQTECPDGSDEGQCRAGCPGIADSQHCDGHWHCAKGEDELGCFGCDADEWWCGEGSDCFKASRRCDGIADCRNQADEVNCSCLSNQTQCSPNSEYCYDLKTQRCDGRLQCPGGQDEMDCGLCRQMIPCGGGGGCYTVAQRCDGALQCGDGSDEINCTPQLCHPQHGAFLCANRRCIRDAWRCDQYDDCGDASDEEECMRNSVIVAAAMGGLVCSLLLVIAVGCTCRLYALRAGIGTQHGVRGGRRSTPLAPLSRLEQHLLQREPPPSYAVAINDPSASLFSGGRISRHWRRTRRRPPVPPEGLVVPGMPVAVRGRLAPSPPGPHPSTAPHPPHYSDVVPGGGRSSRSGDEKESEEEGKVAATHPSPRGVAEGDDVPLLSDVGECHHDDDEPLLGSLHQDTDGEVESESDGEDSTSTSSAEGADTSATDHSDEENDAAECVTAANTPEGPTPIGSEDSVAPEESSVTHVFPNTEESFVTEEDAALIECSEDEGGDDEDTRAAVLALSVVQRHTHGITDDDTELIPH